MSCLKCFFQIRSVTDIADWQRVCGTCQMNTNCSVSPGPSVWILDPSLNRKGSTEPCRARSRRSSSLRQSPGHRAVIAYVGDHAQVHLPGFR